MITVPTAAAALKTAKPCQCLCRRCSAYLTRTPPNSTIPTSTTAYIQRAHRHARHRCRQPLVFPSAGVCSAVQRSIRGCDGAGRVPNTQGSQHAASTRRVAPAAACKIVAVGRRGASTLATRCAPGSEGDRGDNIPRFHALQCDGGGVVPWKGADALGGWGRGVRHQLQVAAVVVVVVAVTVRKGRRGEMRCRLYGDVESRISTSIDYNSRLQRRVVYYATHCSLKVTHSPLPHPTPIPPTETPGTRASPP